MTTATRDELEAHKTIAVRRTNAIWRQKELFLLGVDFFAVFGSMMTAYFLTHIWRYGIQAAKGYEATPLLWKSGVLLGVLWVIVGWHHGVYARGLRGIASPVVRGRAVVMSGVYATCVLVAATALYRAHVLSPLGWLATMVPASSAMLLARVILRRIDRMLARRGVICQRIVVAGSNKESRDFAIRLRAHHSTVRVVGFLLEEDERMGRTFLNYPVLGSLARIEEAYGRAPFDVLVLPPSIWAGANGGDLIRILNFCEAGPVKLYVAGAYDIAVRREEVGSFSNASLIRLEDASIHPGYAAIKRIMDIALASVGILLGLPLWIAIAVAIKLTSKGPVFFSQRRIGLHGRPFKMYKFRSMVQNAEEILDGLVDLENLREPVFKLKNDPRVTRMGTFLRRTGLDEIPQLWSVLTGSMSLVGPRPEEDRIVARYSAHQRRRLKAKPGITGLQQVEYRGGKSLSRRITYDLIYMKHQSLLLDLYILFKTIPVVIRGSGITY